MLDYLETDPSKLATSLFSLLDASHEMERAVFGCLQGVDIVTVKELLGHFHRPGDHALPASESRFKGAGSRKTAKLAGNCDNSTTVRTKMQQSVPRVSQIGR
jgi:hypothetical protein